MKLKYSQISIEPKKELFKIDYFQNEDEMAILFEKAGIYVYDMIYTDL